MCGIAGIICTDTSYVNTEVLTKMTDALAHRGPDGQGLWINTAGNIGLGHRRLSIIDLTNAAAQPMHYLKRYTIVYNGEIYNYIEIKDFLFKKGYRFQSNSDTEVILAAYDFWKEDCLLHFDGMFAFAIVDTVAQQVFAARDRFGEKPFYYAADKELFTFASEMKALWAIGIHKKPDDKMLLNYLTLGYIQNPNNKEQTFFENIISLPPGNYLQFHIKTFEIEIHSYWDIDKETVNNISPADAIEEFNALFTESIQRRLRSDVAVGTSLSGGLDSSSILSAINNKGNIFNTFSAVFNGFEKDESKFIHSVINHLAEEKSTNGPIQQNFTEPSALGLIKDFEKLCYHQEEPFSSGSVYAQYKVFELAKHKNVKVLLDGQGADETLAGYNKHIHWHLQQQVGNNHLLNSYREQKMLTANKIPFKWGFKNYLAAYFPGHAMVHLEHLEYLKLLKQKDIDRGFLESLKGREWEGILKPLITKLNDILYFNTQTLGLEELLRYADRNSMAHGREVRLPFLSHELVKFIFSLPANYKIHDGWTKWLLRKAMDKKLPDEIVWRKDKVGYEPPQQQWMQNEILQDHMQEAKRKLVSKGILNKSVLNKKIEPKSAHDDNNYDWRYLCVAQII